MDFNSKEFVYSKDKQSSKGQLYNIKSLRSIFQIHNSLFQYFNFCFQYQPKSESFS